MSFYQKIAEIGPKYISRAKLYKYGFNFSPMYRRTTAKIIDVSEDLTYVQIRLPISWKNRNYMNTVFGGSMFSAVDPIPMVQLVNILPNEYIVWDKSASIRFKKPARENLYAEFRFSKDEIDDIKKRVAEENEIEIKKTTLLTSKDRKTTFCEIDKVIYIADKAFYKGKKRK